MIWSHGLELIMRGCKFHTWDFQNQGKSCWTGTGFFVLEVPLCNLHPSIIKLLSCHLNGSCKVLLF